jgi:2-keto-4-pentenoate hydratase/2-oxohepta-3-ene-1,7-dioic acid hydratase in catechol pathway
MATSKSTWTHLVRFTHKGVPTFAHVVDPKPDGDLEEQFKVDVATGDPVFNNIVLTGEIVTVTRNTLLAPIATCPIVINTGLNYKDHVTESLFFAAPDLAPPIPYIFYRPATSIADPYPTLLRTYKVQQECLDYECELVFQTGSRPLKDISVEEAKKHIIGFAAGCDFSPRPGKVLGRMNYIFSKAFDNWTPVGPVLVNPSVTGVLPELDISTKWNGKEVQKDNSRNMIFNVAEILSAMSVGTTVQPGTVVFSGTCGGGAWFLSEGKPGTGINDGDEIEVEIKGIGKVRAYPKFD